MNPDAPMNRREELELKITALLLGELPDDEAESIRREIAHDPELTQLHERLKRTVDWVETTVSASNDVVPGGAEPLKLSGGRREKLLQQFKTVAPAEFDRPRRTLLPWYIPMSAAAAVVALLSSLALFPEYRLESKGMQPARHTDAPASESRTSLSRGMYEFRNAPENAGAAAETVSDAHITPSTEPVAVPQISTSAGTSTITVKPAPAQRSMEPELVRRYGLATPPPPTKPVAGQTSGSILAFDKELAKPQESEPGRAGRVAVEAKRENGGVQISDADRRGGVERFRAGAFGGGGGGFGGGGLGGGGTAFPRADEPAFFNRPVQDVSGPVSGLGAVTVNNFGEGEELKQQMRESEIADRSEMFGIETRGRQAITSAGETAEGRTIDDSSVTQLMSVPGSLGRKSGESSFSDSSWGYRASRPEVVQNEVPVLGDVPILGKVFRSENGVAFDSDKQASDFDMVPKQSANMTFGRDRSSLITEEKGPDTRWYKDLNANSDGVDMRAGKVATVNGRGLADAPVALVEESLEEKRNEPKESLGVNYSLSQRLDAEKKNAALQTKQQPVEILRRADPDAPDNSKLWDRIRGRVTGQVERSAEIAMQPEAAGAVPLLNGVASPQAYDPYFVQTESEKIKSKAVLYDVIDKLKLNEEWAEKDGTDKRLTTSETYERLLNRVELNQKPDGSNIELRVKAGTAKEAAQIANTIAEVYRDKRIEKQQQASKQSIELLTTKLQELERSAVREEGETLELDRKALPDLEGAIAAKPAAASAPVAQPEVLTRENPFSTFSLNVSDVSFKLAAASLEKGTMPEAATVRSEEFINAFDYRDSEPPPGMPVAFAWERAQYPFGHNRDLLRFSVKTAAEGRQSGRPLNIVLLLDNSGSMERADRVRILRQAIRALAAQLQPHDKISLVSFARTPRLWIDGISGSQAETVVETAAGLAPQGGTNLEDALNLAYTTAVRHYVQGGVNRIVLLTDGAANLGNLNPDALKQKVESHRKQGIALDGFGIGWEGYNDDLLETLTRNGDGRYGFLNTPEEATTEFAGKLAGALRVAASDVKVQVEFNPRRVTAYRQIGFAKHQLTKEQFRDNTVDAAELGAAEAGNALYVVAVNPRGEGPLAVVRVRYKEPATSEYHEHEWPVPYTGAAMRLNEASAAMRLAAVASGFSEWLTSSPHVAGVTLDQLLGFLSGVPEVYGADPRPKQLEWMIRQAKAISGK